MKQKLSVEPTLKNYAKKNLTKDILTRIIIPPHSCGNHHHGVFDSYIDGLCADIRATGGIWLVWLGIPNHIVCSVFHITAVYIRCGCCSGGACRSSSAWHGNRGRKLRGHDGCTGVYIFCGTVAFGILLHECRKAGELHICAGYGRIYHRHMYYNHTDAGAKAHGLCGRNRRAF